MALGMGPKSRPKGKSLRKALSPRSPGGVQDRDRSWGAVWRGLSSESSVWWVRVLCKQARAGVGRSPGEEGNKKQSRKNPTQAWGWLRPWGPQAELGLGWRGFLGATELLPSSVLPCGPGRGAEAPSRHFVSSHWPPRFPTPKIITALSLRLSAPRPAPKLLVTVLHLPPRALAPRGRWGLGERPPAWGGGAFPTSPSSSPANLGEGGFQVSPSGPTGAGAADVDDFQEEGAGRGRKG